MEAVTTATKKVEARVANEARAEVEEAAVVAVTVERVKDLTLIKEDNNYI